MEIDAGIAGVPNLEQVVANFKDLGIAILLAICYNGDNEQRNRTGKKARHQMNCEICNKPGAENFYGIGIFEHGTEVSTARWGFNITEAKARAKSAVKVFRNPGEFVYDIKVVVAHNRREVVRAYEVK